MDACILVWFNIESAKTVSYINFRRKNTQSELSAGQIAADCPTHTKEEWLKILQAKSQAQGERLSWWQINFRLLPGQKIKLFIGLVLFDEQCEPENYDYIVCECVGLETKQQTRIIDYEYCEIR